MLLLNSYILKHKYNIRNNLLNEFDFKKEVAIHYIRYNYLYTELYENVEPKSIFLTEEFYNPNHYINKILDITFRNIKTIIQTQNKNILYAIQNVDCVINLLLIVIFDRLIFNDEITVFYETDIKTLIQFIMLKEDLKKKYSDNNIKRLNIKEICKIPKLPNDVCNFVIAKFL